MKITTAADRSTKPGEAGYFTGDVKVKTLFSPEAPARTAAASVTFQPGARTA